MSYPFRFISQKCNIVSTLNHFSLNVAWETQRVSLSLYLEEEGLFLPLVWETVGCNHWAKKMVLITDLSLLFLSVFQLLCGFSFSLDTKTTVFKSTVMFDGRSWRNWLTERKQQLGFSLFRKQHLQPHTKPMIMLCLSNNGCFHKCQFEIMMYCSKLWWTSVWYKKIRC